MSGRSAPYFAAVTRRLEDHFAYLGDRAKGRAGAWAKDGSFDPSTLPARTTAVHRTTPAKPAEARKVLPMGGQRPANTVRKPAVAPVAREVEVVTSVQVETVPEMVAAAPVVNEVAAPPQPEPVIEPEPTLEAALVPVRDELVDFLRTCDIEVIERMSARDISRSRQNWIALARDVLHHHELSKLVDLSLDAFNFVDGKKKEAAVERKRQAEEAELLQERGELIERMRAADMEVFAALWVGQNFPRETIIAWAEGLDIATVRDVRWRLDKEVKAHATAKAQASKPAGRVAAVIPAKAIAPKHESGTPKSGGKKSRSTGVSLEELRRLSAKAPAVPAGPAPSAADLADLDRRINGGKVEGSDSGSSGSNGGKEYLGPRVAAPLTLRERIQRLDPAVVARIHRDARHLGNDRWPTIERLLEVESKVDDVRIARFVARCEQG